MKVTISKSVASLVLLLSMPSYAVDSLASSRPLIEQGVIKRVSENPSKVIEIVLAEVELNGAYSGEILIAAIGASKADVKTIVAILEAAIMATPQHIEPMVLGSVAAAPDARQDIIALLERLGVSESASSDAAKKLATMLAQISTSFPPLVKATSLPNPLDNFGKSLPQTMPTVPPLIIPPVIKPPVTTNVNP
jgi:hypothetical protein